MHVSGTALHRAVVCRTSASRLLPVRSMHATAFFQLPRARPGARPRPAAQPSAVPWFMEEQVVDAPSAAQVPTEYAPPELYPPITWLPPYLPATSDIPEAIAQLLDLCITGSLSALIARPAVSDEIIEDDWSERVRASPIAVVKPMDRSETVGSQGQDWIIIIQVRGSGVGPVRRVATEIGNYVRNSDSFLTQLKRTVPPEPAPAADLSLDDLLGPAHVVGENDAAVNRGPRPLGVSRIEHEYGQRMPAWQIQKIALERKFPDGWTPMTKLSHEAQHGLRLLHESNPDRFNIATLARRFRISPESVRRILRSRWQATPEAVARQNRRAHALEATRFDDREAAEIAALRGVSIETEPPRVASGSVTSGAHDQPVRFEGLVSSADLAAGRQRQKSIASRGSGDWCLVDAGWCVVHVMTHEARERYHIEDMWKHNGIDKM